MRYITITVKPYPYPISYHGKYYYRSGATNRELTGNALDEFILKKQGKTWDGVPVPNIKTSDLDIIAFREFRRKALLSKRLSDDDLLMSDAALVDSLLLADGNYLKRAAALLFHENPEKFAVGSFVKIGFFESGVDLLYQDEVHGPIITMADKVIDIIYTKYFKGMISYDGIQRVETYPVPRAACREAVLNAIVHKSYSSGVPIQIKVFPSEVIIFNDGGLPDGWTVDDLLSRRVSMPRNPNIANAFFRSGQIETWGRGIEKMEFACKANGNPAPSFKPDAFSMQVTFSVPNTEMKVDGDVVGKLPNKVAEKLPNKVAEKLTSGEKVFLESLLSSFNEHEWITNAEARNATGKSGGSVKRFLRNLAEKGVLEARGETKDRRYRLIVKKQQ